MTQDNILKSFQATGVWPMDAEVILKRFYNTNSEQDEASRLGQHVDNKARLEARRLEASLHSLQVQNELLHYENDGLLQAAKGQKKHKTKSKTMDLQRRKEYHGGAVFWSPRKLREARAREATKRHEAEREQLQKTHDRELKAAAKLYQKRQAEAAKVAQQHAAEERKMAKKAKAEELAAARALKKLQRDAATAQKSHDTSNTPKRKASHKAGNNTAKRRREQKDRDTEQLQQQKAAAIQAREDSKLIKAREIDARRRARAEAKLLREKKRTDEAAERAARQAARKAAKRLQQTIKTSQKSKKKSLQARTKPKPKKSIEAFIVDWIIEEDTRSLPPSHARVREMATRILRLGGDHEPLGQRWISSFLARQPRVASIVGRSIDTLRAEAASPAQILAFLELFYRTRIELNIRVEDIWNMNETGIALGVCTNSQVVARAGKRKAYVKTPGDHEWVSILETISATGQKLRCIVIFKGQSLQTTWFPSSSVPDWLYTTSKNGWTSHEIGIEWLRCIFIPDTQPHGDQWRILILDGHGSHVDIEFMLLCRQHRIWTIYLPPHASHLLTPLISSRLSSPTASRPSSF
ncbi:transposase tan1 [Pyrenophora tritici-repentis]|uniref:Transposase tan1 n=1 Tax=Pyrenophora tritici-repentis TaxID=45151 RepID=A0A922N1D2_9PLEO|nr:transposase tan1 [Pyrenophora tritici-repentis]